LAQNVDNQLIISLELAAGKILFSSEKYQE